MRKLSPFWQDTVKAVVFGAIGALLLLAGLAVAQSAYAQVEDQDDTEEYSVGPCTARDYRAAGLGTKDWQSMIAWKRQTGQNPYLEIGTTRNIVLYCEVVFTDYDLPIKG